MRDEAEREKGREFVRDGIFRPLRHRLTPVERAITYGPSTIDHQGRVERCAGAAEQN